MKCEPRRGVLFLAWLSLEVVAGLHTQRPRKFGRMPFRGRCWLGCVQDFTEWELGRQRVLVGFTEEFCFVDVETVRDPPGLESISGSSTRTCLDISPTSFVVPMDVGQQVSSSASAMPSHDAGRRQSSALFHRTC